MKHHAQAWADKAIEHLRRVADAAKATGSGDSDAGSVAKALLEGLRAGDPDARALASEIGLIISKSIRGRGQIDFQRSQ
jgi:hypothetical protein